MMMGRSLWKYFSFLTWTSVPKEVSPIGCVSLFFTLLFVKYWRSTDGWFRWRKEQGEEKTSLWKHRSPMPLVVNLDWRAWLRTKRDIGRTQVDKHNQYKTKQFFYERKTPMLLSNDKNIHKKHCNISINRARTFFSRRTVLECLGWPTTW